MAMRKVRGPYALKARIPPADMNIEFKSWNTRLHGFGNWMRCLESYDVLQPQRGASPADVPIVYSHLLCQLLPKLSLPDLLLKFFEVRPQSGLVSPYSSRRHEAICWNEHASSPSLMRLVLNGYSDGRLYAIQGSSRIRTSLPIPTLGPAIPQSEPRMGRPVFLCPGFPASGLPLGSNSFSKRSWPSCGYNLEVPLRFQCASYDALDAFPSWWLQALVSNALCCWRSIATCERIVQASRLIISWGWWIFRRMPHFPTSLCIEIVAVSCSNYKYVSKPRKKGRYRKLSHSADQVGDSLLCLPCVNIV